jgi:dTDP-4-amino-4,6-dideoxygalactose transaminase
MDSLQAAVLNVKMNYIEAWTEARRTVASHYDRLLNDHAYGKPASLSHARHVYHVYAVTTTERDDVQTALQGAGIGASIHYPVPVHLQPAYAGLGYSRGDLPVTEALAMKFLSLPVYPELQLEQIKTIVAELQKASLLKAA